MTEQQDVLKEILNRLNAIDPPLKKIAVDPDDKSMTMQFINLKDIAYITSQADTGRDETMFVINDDQKYYNNQSLKDLEKTLAEHPHFLRTSKFYIINLTKVRGFKYSNARDLWFEGVKDKIENAVTNTYLEEFENHLK